MSVAEVSPIDSFYEEYSNYYALPIEAAVAISGIVIQLGNRVKEFTEHTIFIDHALENQLVIPVYASHRAESKQVRD